MGDIADNLARIRERIALAVEKSGREAQAIRLIAVTKSMPVERISEAIEAGLTEFGENRVQEAEVKIPRVRKLLGPGRSGDGPSWHMIGSLQRNKARQASDLFDCIQSVDRVELVHALDKSFAECPGMKKLPIFIQVNVTREERKSGISPENLPTVADAVMASNNLQGAGLMTIARLGENERELRDTFATLRSLRDGLRHSHSASWIELSMGMSDDYGVAIEEGATVVRLGRALFGVRSTSTIGAIG